MRSFRCSQESFVDQADRLGGRSQSSAYAAGRIRPQMIQVTCVENQSVYAGPQRT